MSIQPEETEEKSFHKPQVFFENITFNDGTLLPLQHSSIVVFTGANNCGKSQVLKDAENFLDKSNHIELIVIRNIEISYYGTIEEETFFQENFFVDSKGQCQVYGTNLVCDRSALKQWWDNHSFYNEMHKLFIKRLSTEFRLTASNALIRNKQPEKHPIFKLHKNENLAHELSDLFNQAFGFDLIVNRNEMNTIPLHIGQAPDKAAYTIANQDEYYKIVNTLPKLEEQGDGMRSFASILLDTFTSDKKITLIDEPEAFLHPPQARLLGKMLAKYNSETRQLFISTHSEDFLQGLLDANNENVTVIRINRENNINNMSVLNNSEIKTLWGNPLLRYSNILSGLFHEKVFVCESDYDCLFYKAIMDAIYEKDGAVAPDILFTHCGGKTRIKDVIRALKAVNVPVVAVCDFDLLNASQNLKLITGAFGIDWDSSLSSYMQIIYDSMNAKNSNGVNSWEQIKKIGKHGFTDEEPVAYEKVESICIAAGLFIVPVGEMECFDKTINKVKKEWVYDVLGSYDLALEPKFEEARNFIQAVIDYK